MFSIEISKHIRDITGFISVILLHDKAVLYSFYRWRKQKALLFWKHTMSERLFWHARSSCCLCSSLFCAFQFSFEKLPLFSKHSTYWDLFHESAFSWAWIPKHRELELHSATDHLQKGWLHHLAQLHRGVKEPKRQNSEYHLITLTRHLFALLSLIPCFKEHTPFLSTAQQVLSPHYRPSACAIKQTEVQLPTIIKVFNDISHRASNFSLFYSNIWAKHKVLLM